MKDYDCEACNVSWPHGEVTHHIFECGECGDLHHELIEKLRRKVDELEREVARLATAAIKK